MRGRDKTWVWLIPLNVLGKREYSRGTAGMQGGEIGYVYKGDVSRKSVYLIHFPFTPRNSIMNFNSGWWGERGEFKVFIIKRV